MNNIIFNYLIRNYLKTVFIVILIIYSFGLILNLFEEIEFFKESNASILKPLILSGIFIPSLVIKLLPFIIFFSSIWFITKIKNNKDLLILKVHGYSNFKIFFILATTSFLFGWMILIIANPITSSMVTYYEKTKSEYARDIEHLISFNKNGLWIKENLDSRQRIISADKPDGFKLINVTIYHLDQNSNLEEKIFSEEVDIKENTWKLEKVTVFRPLNGILVKENIEYLQIKSIYNFEKINSLFKNFNTMSFFELITNISAINSPL